MKYILIVFLWWFIGAYLGWRLWAKRRINSNPRDYYGRPNPEEYWFKLFWFGFLGPFPSLVYAFGWLDRLFDELGKKK